MKKRCRRDEAGKREAEHDQNESEIAGAPRPHGRRRALLRCSLSRNARKPGEPEMQRQTDENVHAGKDEIDVLPVQSLQHTRGQWPEDGRRKSGNQRQIGDAALRLGFGRLCEESEGCRIEHEGRGEFDED